MKQTDIPLTIPEGEADTPLDVSEEECELTENEVDMLMDALDDDDDDNDLQQEEQHDLGAIEPLNDEEEDEDEHQEEPAKVNEFPASIDSKYSFSLPTDVDEENANAEPSSEDAATEPTSGSDEPLIEPSANIPQDKMRKRVKQEQEESSKFAKPTPSSGKRDEWDEARAVSHLLLSPYDASFGLLSRVDTR